MITNRDFTLCYLLKLQDLRAINNMIKRDRPIGKRLLQDDSADSPAKRPCAENNPLMKRFDQMLNDRQEANSSTL